MVKEKVKKQFKVVPIRLTNFKFVDMFVGLYIVQDKCLVKPNDFQDLPAGRDNADQPNRHYYVQIKNLSRLVSSQLNKNLRKNFCANGV